MADSANAGILEIVRRYIRALRQSGVRFESAWLFGSAARGAADADSDIDVAIVMPGTRERFFIELELMKRRRGIDLRIEPHAITENDRGTEWEQHIRHAGIRVD